MYITDEAAAVAAEGPDGLDKAPHHVPMPKPHLHFNLTSQGMFTLFHNIPCCSPHQASNLHGTEQWLYMAH